MKLKQWCEYNGYYLKDKIDFIWGRHGDGIPTITEILKLIGDPGFEYVIKNHEDKVKEAANIGTQIHSDAEKFFNAKSGITTINKNFMMFHSLYNVKILKQEETIYKDGLRGTIDLIGYLEDYTIKKGIYNIDYKNTSKHSLKYCLQLGGYEYLNGNPGCLVYGKGKLKVIFVEDYYLDLFIELKDYFFTLLKFKM